MYRLFGSGKRSSLSNLEENRAEELGQHVHAVSIGDERPLPVHADRRSADLGRPKPKKLQSRRRPASTSALQFPYDQSREKTSKKLLLPTAGTSRAMARTVAIQPIQTTGLNMPPDLYSISEDGQNNDAADSPRSPFSSYPMYPGLQTSPGKVPGTPPPTALNFPRKLSNGSNSTSSSTTVSRESARSELQRSSSWGSKTSFESLDSGAWKPVEYGGAYRTPEPLKRRRTTPQPGEQFAALPGEVLGLILDMVKGMHLKRGSDSCATCWMRDMCNISLASHRWYKFARIALYEDIQLVGPDSISQKKRFKLVHGSRMLMLRRTLRSDPEIASLVRSLKVPRPDVTAKGTNTKTLEQYEDLTASLVMACPSLERLSGPPTGYAHSFKKIYQALSTRGQLRQMDWLVEPTTAQKQKTSQSGPKKNEDGFVMPGELQPCQEGAFLDMHRNWSHLNTLSIHCLPGATITPDSLLTRTLSMLPSLEHLHLCNLPPNAFNDTTLLALPPLQTLSLTHITGITSSGLSAFGTQANSQPLRQLHLRHTPLTSLAALARILSNLVSLTSFSLAQAFPPLMPEADSFTLWMMPYLFSPNLHKLHWDITSHLDCANVADDILARSIAAGGFPQLRLLRAPNDPDAVFQNLCRPVERIDLASDRFCPSDMPQGPTSPLVDAIPPSPGLFLTRSPKTPTTPSAELLAPPASSTDLRIARLAAQTRLEAARSKPNFAVNVIDEDGSMVDNFHLGGYVGTVGSQILYHLLPDTGSSDDKGGLVDARDLGADLGENLVNGMEGCQGFWNRREGVVADKKEKERWWHTERGRWNRIELQ